MPAAAWEPQALRGAVVAQGAWCAPQDQRRRPPLLRETQTLNSEPFQLQAWTSSACSTPSTTSTSSSLAWVRTLNPRRINLNLSSCLDRERVNIMAIHTHDLSPIQLAVARDQPTLCSARLLPRPAARAPSPAAASLVQLSLTAWHPEGMHLLPVPQGAAASDPELIPISPLDSSLPPPCASGPCWVQTPCGMPMGWWRARSATPGTSQPRTQVGRGGVGLPASAPGVPQGVLLLGQLGGGSCPAQRRFPPHPPHPPTPSTANTC